MQAVRYGAVVHGVKVESYGTKGTQSLEFGDHGIAVILETPEDCDEVIRAAIAAKSAMLAARKPAAHMCRCDHFEAYHVGAVLGDAHPGQCTAIVDDGDDCGCQRYTAKQALTAVSA